MELELHPAVILPPRSFCTLIAPVEVLVGALNSHINLQRFKTLYICGNFSRVLSRMDRNFVGLEIRRAFTAFQLLTILEEARHTLIFVEHDPTLYEDAEEIPEYISHALRDLANRATVVLYAPSVDPYLEEMARRADRVFYLQGPERSKGKGSAAKLKLAESANQTTLEAF
jgi:DNA polymerase I